MYLWSVWIQLKIEKYYNKIIFKRVNIIVGPIFNEKVDKKCNLWVRKQCIYALFTAESNRKVNLCGYCSLNSNRKTPTRVKTKKKKEQKRKLENAK